MLIQRLLSLIENKEHNAISRQNRAKYRKIRNIGTHIETSCQALLRPGTGVVDVEVVCLLRVCRRSVLKKVGKRKLRYLLVWLQKHIPRLGSSGSNTQNLKNFPRRQLLEDELTDVLFCYPRATKIHLHPFIPLFLRGGVAGGSRRAVVGVRALGWERERLSRGCGLCASCVGRDRCVRAGTWMEEFRTPYSGGN
jgi:hypothetical protein